MQQSITGRRVLLIVVPRPHVADACFFVGVARCDGTGISVADDHGRSTAIFQAPAEALRAFDPERLPRLIVREHYQQIRRLIGDIDGCVAVFTDSAPAGGMVLREAFYGLGTGAPGQPLLFQGDPEVYRADRSEDDEESEPWISSRPDDGD